MAFLSDVIKMISFSFQVVLSLIFIDCCQCYLGFFAIQLQYVCYT